jgi:hypothetical protein
MGKNKNSYGETKQNFSFSLIYPMSIGIMVYFIAYEPELVIYGFAAMHGLLKPLILNISFF